MARKSRPVFDWTGFACPCFGISGDEPEPEPSKDEFIAAYEALERENADLPPCFNSNRRFDYDRLARAYALDGETNETFPDGTGWAFGCVFHLACDYPMAALDIIRLAALYATTEKQRLLIGCGHLETLLGRHSGKVISEVERLARESPAFRECLSHVWQHGMPDDHWTRVLTASGRQRR